MLVDIGVLKRNSHTILKFDHKVLRTSLSFHWKMACMPLLDNTPKWCKSGSGYTKFVQDT
jgi:hypothetical protein